MQSRPLHFERLGTDLPQHVPNDEDNAFKQNKSESESESESEEINGALKH